MNIEKSTINLTLKKKKLEQPRAENRESNYGSITLSQKK